MSAPNKRTKRTGPIQTLHFLWTDLAAVIPALARDNNEPLPSTAHVEDTGHDDATPLNGPPPSCRRRLDIPDLLSKSGGIHTDYQETKQSRLLDDLDTQEALIYQNETEVQSYVVDALMDAVAALGLRHVLKIRPEISLFSYRPDIIVVSHSTRGIILVVQVKKPGRRVFTSHSVAGQVYDYLVGMFGMGIAYPFAVLTTYEELVIAHLHDQGKSQEILSEVAGKMGEEEFASQQATFLEGGEMVNEGERPGPTRVRRGSPLSKRNPVVSTRMSQNNQEMNDAATTTADGHTLDADQERDDDSDDSDWNRCLHYSNVVERENVLKALMLAIRCGIASCMNSPPRPLPIQGSTPSFACARVNENGMVWGDLPSRLKVDYFTAPAPTTKSFYLLNDLDKGSSGRAFLVCSPGGKTLVAKFFFIKDIVTHRPPESAYERQTRRAELLALRKSEAEKEMQYWNTVYDSKYNVQVRKLHGHWCLLLPYFDPIPDVESRRRYLSEIRLILEHFKSKNLKYNMDDVRWRHVGIRQNQICLFDLGSLEPCKEGNGSSIDVAEQMRMLEKNIEPCL